MRENVYPTPHLPGMAWMGGGQVYWGDARSGLPMNVIVREHPNIRMLVSLLEFRDVHHYKFPCEVAWIFLSYSVVLEDWGPVSNPSCMAFRAASSACAGHSLFS